MYDELVKELRDSAEWADRLALLMGRAEGDAHAPVMRKAADAIEELICEVADEHNARLDAEERQRWIPVTERLPECDGERVLVASNFLTSYLRVSICYFSKNLEDVGYDFDGEKRSGFYVHDPEYGYYERQCVRYWMPLPQPPKEG